MTQACSYLLVTAHDMRAPRKANIHFIAEELAKRGPTRVFSLGFSSLSEMKGKDSRIGLGAARNSIRRLGEVECFLWWTIVHPFNPRLSCIQPAAELAFKAYVKSAPKVLWAWAKEADYILVESGMGAAFLKALRKAAPQANIIYIASDDLVTIGAAPYLINCLIEAAPYLNGVRVPSRALKAAMPAGSNTYYVPHGVSEELAEVGDESPYQSGVNAVCVGSMLFDTQFFHIATGIFPDVKFHVIGSGEKRRNLPASVQFYPEMKFLETLPYIKFADVGIAPYKSAELPYYLADTSMKILQYEYFGLSVVCPNFVVGTHYERRFGYTPGNLASIQWALSNAFRRGKSERRSGLSWSEVVDRILNPAAYADTQI